ncbi:MAG: hypothetical protein ACRD2N_25135 [Vicinamibacterales bacterium]
MSPTPEGPLSKTQLDSLGNRLRAGTADEADLRALDEYRRSFRAAYDDVVGTVKTDVGLEGTGRPAKTTAAIVDKLRRQPIRLTQIQDSSGLRVIVDGIREQNRIVERLQQTFVRTSSDDRRIESSHGYRAVHVIVFIRERVVEIQVRTHEQHLWAEISEKLADIIDPKLKYGGGAEQIRRELLNFSNFLATVEPLEESLSETESRLMSFATRISNPPYP